jgi:hypothetical protein
METLSTFLTSSPFNLKKIHHVDKQLTKAPQPTPPHFTFSTWGLKKKGG